MNKIKAIIFDMDGVLVETKDWHYEALNKALKPFGMEISLDEHLVKYDGIPTSKKLEMLSKEKGLSKGLHTIINTKKQQYTMDIVYASCKPTFHQEFTLGRLKENGYKMAVCSNSIRNTIEIMMEKASLKNYFEFYISSQDVTNCKPDPEMYNEAIERLGLKSQECMIVEDNENGIKAARASGAWVMEVDSVEDVNYENIKHHIQMFEEKI